MLRERLQPFINRDLEISSLLVSPDILLDIKRMTQLSKEQKDMSELVLNAKNIYIL